MATIVVKNDPVMITDGTRQALVTATDEFYYGFGDTLPETWHRYYMYRDAIVFGTEYGKVWIKKSTEPNTVGINVSYVKA